MNLRLPPETAVNNTGQAPVNKNTGQAPVYKNTGQAPVYKNTGQAPVYKNTGQAPVNKDTGQAPVNKDTGQAPVNKDTGQAAAEFADLKSKPAVSKVQDVAKQEDASNSSQIAVSTTQVTDNKRAVPNWSEFVTSSKRHRGAAYRPTAFTEHGAIMAATVLNSPEAVAMKTNLD